MTLFAVSDALHNIRYKFADEHDATVMSAMKARLSCSSFISSTVADYCIPRWNLP